MTSGLMGRWSVRMLAAVFAVVLVLVLGISGSRPDLTPVDPSPSAAAARAPDLTLPVGRAAPVRAVVLGLPVIVPGTERALDVELYNPNVRTVTVTRLEVSVSEVRGPRTSRRLPCGADDFRTRPGRPSVVQLGPGETVSLSQALIPQRLWPRLGMIDSATNQDGCQGAELLLDVQVEGTVR